MNKKHLIFFALVIAVLALTLSGCGKKEQNFNGMNIATFELNGGTLEFKTSSVNTKINFAYHPGTYILDPAEIPGYKLYKIGYDFTGWYTSPDCKPGELWDFDKKTFDTETLTLYAGWEKSIKFTFSLYYMDGENEVFLNQYKVSKGDIFDDWRNYAAGRQNYTPIGYYSDKALSTPWDNTITHPGGETDTDIRVYVDYIPGKWTLVDSYAKLSAALSANENVYLTCDIDCGGEELYLKTAYSSIFEGNGFTVADFTVPRGGFTYYPSAAIFDTLSAGAEIRNVSFDRVEYNFFELNDKKREVRVAALAKDATGAKVTNVTISGTFNTDYTGELDKLNTPFFTEEGCTVTDVSVNIVLNVTANA